MTSPVRPLLRVLVWSTMGASLLAWQSTTARERASALASLVAAERAFAAATAELGVRNGFLTFFADNAVALQLGGSEGGARVIPARDRFIVSPQPDWPLASVLSWTPDTGQVSADGSMGWLTGPYANRNATGAMVGQGAYFSVWRRQTDGTWKVWLDQGVSLPSAWTDANTFHPAVEPDTRAATEDIGAVEAQLHDNSPGWGSRLAPGVRLHRDGVLPMVGRDVVAAWRRGAWTTVDERVVSIERAGSRDMAVVLGGYTATAPSGIERGIFARVWQAGREGRWEIVFETSKRGA